MAEDKSEIREDSKYWWWASGAIWGLGVIGIIFLAFLIYYLHSIPISNRIGDWGAFGDAIGGVFNPIVAACALIMLSVSVYYQRIELKAVRKEMKEVNEHNDDIKKIEDIKGFMGLAIDQFSGYLELKIVMIQGSANVKKRLELHLLEFSQLNLEGPPKNTECHFVDENHKRFFDGAWDLMNDIAQALYEWKNIPWKQKQVLFSRFLQEEIF